MNSRINRIGCIQQADGSIDIVVPASMAEQFKAMVKRGTNISPNMHTEIRDFTDRLFKREHLMNGNMLWDIPAEDKYELELHRILDKKIVIKSINILFPPDKSEEKGTCYGHPETCNCPAHCK